MNDNEKRPKIGRENFNVYIFTRILKYAGREKNPQKERPMSSYCQRCNSLNLLVFEVAETARNRQVRENIYNPLKNQKQKRNAKIRKKILPPFLIRPGIEETRKYTRSLRMLSLYLYLSSSK